MGSRGRSIRLRIYILVAIPLITMLGLFGYVAYTSITNFQNLDRSPGLIQGTSVPITRFVSLLQAERRAAVVYLSHPDTANANAYQASVMATKVGELPLEAALDSPATKSSANAQENAAITTWVGEVNGMVELRAGVAGTKLTSLDAFAAYTKIITDQDSVFQAQASSLTDTFASSQGLGLIASVNAREDLDEQDAVLAGALAAGLLTPADRVAFAQAAGRQQDDTALYSVLLTPAELSDFNAQVGTPAVKALSTDLTAVQQAVEGGATLREVEQSGLSSAAWQKLTGTVAAANFQGGLAAASADLVNVQQQVNGAKNRVWVTAIVGAAGLILTLLVSLLLSRSINRRLSTLRRSALTLAQEQLPSVVARLRRGESVDVAAEAPPLQVGSDEIGQVGQAIDTVRQTAIRSAIDEARVRQGVNDMFRNLARRNQSLLQRQLTVLDEAERRATDPDVLEDLFKMDHLTTRMRRHAEGLIILSGAPPGRSWSAPVKLIDVMRGAVAEVEDYARVTVSVQSRAALAGSAVTDVIHLLAELIENATTLSPPYTQVRVGGETVANGFAIEIEDRGLGMVPQRLRELNERLANPPDINPANTEQLGLFVVGQLARRHGVRVVLRTSPYGGTTAVVLIPLALIVEEGPAAITSGGRAPATAGTSANGSYSANGAYNNGAYANGAASARPGGARTGATTPGGNGTASRPAAYGNGSTPRRGGGYPSTASSDPRGLVASTGDYAAGNQDPSRLAVRVPSALRPPEAAGSFGATGGYSTGGGNGAAPDAVEPGVSRGRHGTDDVPVVTGVPVGRPTVPSAEDFDVFTPVRRTGQDESAAPEGGYQQQYPDFAGQGADPYVSPYGDAPEATAYQGGNAAYPGNTGAYQDGGNSGGNGPYGEGGSYGNEAAFGNNRDNSGSYQERDPADSNGLPRRVRQANLAPQLRASAAAGSQGSTEVPQATAASLADMRNTLSAMQRGWQQGRSQTQRDTED
jgi:signal transduction histidine kinase